MKPARKSTSAETTATALSQRIEATKAARAQKFAPGQNVHWIQLGEPIACRVLDVVRPDLYRVEFRTPRREFEGRTVVCLGVEALRARRGEA